MFYNKKVTVFQNNYYTKRTNFLNNKKMTIFYGTVKIELYDSCGIVNSNCYVTVIIYVPENESFHYLLM